MPALNYLNFKAKSVKIQHPALRLAIKIDSVIIHKI